MYIAKSRRLASLLTGSRTYSGRARIVLGIETSCDDTGVAIVSTDRRILAERVFSQWSEHKRHGRPTQRHSQLTAFSGGVVPHLARQLHYDILPRAVSECMEEAFGAGLVDWTRVDALAVTVKPGLEPCLWEGINFTKLLLKRHPNMLFVPIHHMQAHALTCRLFDNDIAYPFLTLLISGGHCLLALVRDFQTFEVLGHSLDISPGNCIDKIARQLGLFELDSTEGSRNVQAQSGGALVESYARSGDPERYVKVIQMIRTYCLKNKDCQFSFGGLLSYLHRLIDKLATEETTSRTLIVSGIERRILLAQTISDICAVMQHAVIGQLEDRLKRALIYLRNRDVDVKHVVVSGGVASNEFIRSKLTNIVEGQFSMKISCPPVKYCTDNGVMIAWNGCEKLEHESSECVPPEKQNSEFFDLIKPLGKSELGVDLSMDIKLLNIKVK